MPEKLLRNVPDTHIENSWDYKKTLKSLSDNDMISDHAKNNNYLMSKFDNMYDYSLYMFFNNLSGGNISVEDS